MAKYRKKPVEIEAVQLCWKNWDAVCDLLGDIVNTTNPGRITEKFSEHCGDSAPYIELTIPTLEGDMFCKHGDYVVRGVKGEFYPCKPNIFRATYELVEE